MRALGMLVLLVLGSGEALGENFVFEGSAPSFRISIPNIPPIKMQIHPQHNEKPHLRYLGEDGPYTVSILTPTADPGMTPVECASSSVKAVVSSGLVPSSQVYRARINEITFVMIYAIPQAGFVQLHAHFMTAMAGTHCVDVHVSKASTSPEDVNPWFK